jgi:phosphoglycerol transferase MdoB-like AlkP superfamily enzyme
MRPEFEVLTGLETADLAFDQFDPYLRGEAFAGSALPRRLSAAGFDTIFLHPYDARFFRRHRVMPAFGFARLIDESEFSRGDRYGPYVGDRAVARWIVGEIEKAKRPLFLFAVTMENHGPWRAGRIEGLDPQNQYIAHLRNADGMLADLLAALSRDRRRAALVCYGDHAPVSVDIGPFRETALTPFVVVAWRCGNATPATRTEISPARLHDVLVSLIEA